MIYEYALDPEVVATWVNRHDFRYFVEKFGLGQPRLVSRYPKRWRRLVWDAYRGQDDIERKRLEELLSRFSEKTINRLSSKYDGGSWLDNAEDEHGFNPFKALVTEGNPKKHPFVLVAGDLGGKSEPLWDIPRTVVVNRSANDMALVVAPLLSAATKIIFVDPHFGPENARYRRTFQAFLQAIDSQRKSELKTVEFHAEAKSPETFFREQCHTRLTKLIPVGMRVSFVRWMKKDEGQRLHNRYILTELGGVSFQHGLDDGKKGDTDDVSLLDRKNYELRWAQYVGDAPAFNLAEEPFELTGVKK